jgi:hypothetical protein
MRVSSGHKYQWGGTTELITIKSPALALNANNLARTRIFRTVLGTISTHLNKFLEAKQCCSLADFHGTGQQEGRPPECLR